MNLRIFSCEIDTEIRRQCIERRLRRVVGRAMRGDGNATEERRDVNEVTATPRDEMRYDCLHSVQRRFDIHSHHLVELTIRELEHRARDPASRVVDPDVDAAECAQRLIAKAIDIRSPRY